MRRISLAVLLAMVSFVAQVQSQSIEQRQASLSDRIDVEFTDLGLITVLDELAIIGRIPIGFERSANDPEIARITVNAKQITLEELLNEITRQEPAYRWELNQGVVNLVPVKNRSPFLGELLQIRVHSFVQAKTEDKFAIRDALFALPEVRSFFDRNQIEGSKDFYLYGRSIYAHENSDLRLSNMTVREILNSIVLRTEFRIWVVKILPDRKHVLLSL